MHWPRNKLKKVPLPFSRMHDEDSSKNKLDSIIWNTFVRMFGPPDNWPINTKQRKDWGQFLSDRGVVWEVRLKKEPNWEGWEPFKGKGGILMRPQNMDTYIEINHYFIPKDLAMKMLALGELL